MRWSLSKLCFSLQHITAIYKLFSRYILKRNRKSRTTEVKLAMSEWQSKYWIHSIKNGMVGKCVTGYSKYADKQKFAPSWKLKNNKNKSFLIYSSFTEQSCWFFSSRPFKLSYYVLAEINVFVNSELLSVISFMIIFSKHLFGLIDWLIVV